VVFEQGFEGLEGDLAAEEEVLMVQDK